MALFTLAPLAHYGDMEQNVARSDTMAIPTDQHKAPCIYCGERTWLKHGKQGTPICERCNAQLTFIEATSPAN